MARAWQAYVTNGKVTYLTLFKRQVSIMMEGGPRLGHETEKQN